MWNIKYISNLRVDSENVSVGDDASKTQSLVA